MWTGGKGGGQKRDFCVDIINGWPLICGDTRAINKTHASADIHTWMRQILTPKTGTSGKCPSGDSLPTM